jgi:hypothetical protein
LKGLGKFIYSVSGANLDGVKSWIRSLNKSYGILQHSRSA